MSSSDDRDAFLAPGRRSLTSIRPDGPGEYRCPVCGQAVTRGPSGTEYGHQRGTETRGAERCPRRPEDGVDPEKADSLGGSD